MTLFELLAAAAMARIVTADLWTHASHRLQRMRVMMMVAMLMIAIGPVHVFVLGIDCLCWLAG
jgi:hypothetical protein